MFLSRWFKILVIFSIILALIGIFTYNVVDYHGYMQGIAKTANHNQNGKNQGGPIPDHTIDNSTVADGIPLRIMFIGASVTRGEQSTGDRGYRKHIRDVLMSYGNPVNSVGFNRFGDWEDNDVEGWGAHRIRKMTLHAKQSVPVLEPNLILVQVGTSDCFQRDETDHIGERMQAMTEIMLDAVPETTVILSTLTTTPNEEFEPCILDANSQIRQVANNLERANRSVALAEMHYGQGLPGRPGPEDIVGDKIHPTDAGYIMMGEIFLEKIREVERKGFLHPPANNSIPDNGDDGRVVEDRIREKAEKENPIKRRSARRAPLKGG